MAARDPKDRQLISSSGGLQGWVNTEDCDARMAHVRANSPTNLEWHARKLGIDLATCTDAERRRVETARKLWFKRLQMKARAGQKAAKARRLREQADRLQAVAEALDTLDEESGA